MLIAIWNPKITPSNMKINDRGIQTHPLRIPLPFGGSTGAAMATLASIGGSGPGTGTTRDSATGRALGSDTPSIGARFWPNRAAAACRSTLETPPPKSFRRNGNSKYDDSLWIDPLSKKKNPAKLARVA